MPEPNMYEQAGKHAQPEVQDAIARFRTLPEHERAELPLLWWLLQDSTQVYKTLKQDALYTDHASSRRTSCATCDYLYESVRFGLYICSQIEGTVEPSGWCRLWEHDPNAKPYK
jgi:hypothetical protein